MAAQPGLNPIRLTRRLAGWLMPLGLFLAAQGVALAETAYRWVQYGPAGLEARAIVMGTGCPSIEIDGASRPMAVRSDPGPDYPISVCVSVLPQGTRQAMIEGAALALPKERPQRILLIGDTGCRLKGILNQACNDEALWPFRPGAAIAARQQPDLVIHVGDFHYRESPCLASFLGCAGSPWGDTWDVWRADFFAPAAPLLESAPWIFVRGNHEECDRGGKGWARTLDPYPWSSQDGCLGPAAPFVAAIGPVSVVVMDVSTTDEDRVNAAQVAHYRAQFEAVRQLVPQGPAWLAFHRPIWTPNDQGRDGQAAGENKTLAAAARDTIPANVTLMLSGHKHRFEVDAYEEDLPIQIVAGHGGDMLDEHPPENPTGLTVGNVRIKSGFGKPRSFGFSLLEDQGDGKWSITDYDTEGRALGGCRLRDRSAECDGR
jgi:hypothetical protein